MKLRSYLLIANGVSIGLIMIFLLFSYIKMLLSLDVVLWLSGVTLLAGLLSSFVHFLFTRPVERSIRRIAQEAQKIAEGNFQGQVRAEGPQEFRILARQFNEMSRKLEESFDRLRTSEASRRELVENVSHDLRTPMASIQSFVEALQDDVIRDEQTFSRYLDTIRQETRRLSGLIDDLFQLSRLQAGTETFSPERCHLEDLFLEILQSYTLRLEEKDLEVVVRIPDAISAAAIMPSKIKRVLSNLLENAIRYSPRGGSIKLAAEDTGNAMLMISVEDEGEGIAEMEREMIFERFYRTDKSRSRESGGAGLGLAISKSLVELHGGTIGVDSSLGRGSRFWFTLQQYERVQPSRFAQL